MNKYTVWYQQSVLELLLITIWIDSYAMPCVSQTEPCISEPCQNGGSCYDNGGSGFLCICVDGFTGLTCEMVTHLIIACSFIILFQNLL